MEGGFKNSVNIFINNLKKYFFYKTNLHLPSLHPSTFYFLDLIY